MTVYENITILAKICKYDRLKIDKRIDHLLQLVDLDLEFKYKYPHQLSGGEQQRVGICRAMMLNPRIFLLDEAFNALDVTMRNEIHEELLSLQKAEPRTIILVTHDVNEAMKLADKILILDQGKIQQYAEPELLRKKPVNSIVKRFIQDQQI
jgi:osmoprotectant transport system ATP-binding protein